MNSITTDVRFLEIVSAFIDRKVTDDLFQISYPSVKEGNQPNSFDQAVQVSIVPKNKSHLYSHRTVSYHRVSLAELPSIEVIWQSEGTVHELMQRDMIPNLKLFELPSERTGVRGRVRFLKPLLQDIINDPIVTTTNRTKLVLRAHPESYFFFGQKEITIVRND